MQYMAYNHNGTELMIEPADYKTAKREADEYTYYTCNPSYVEAV